MTKSVEFWTSVREEIDRQSILDDFKCTWQGKPTAYINIVHRESTNPKQEHYEVLARSDAAVIEVALHVEQMSSPDACLRRVAPIDKAQAAVSAAVGRDVFVGKFGTQSAQVMVTLDGESPPALIAEVLRKLIWSTWPLLNPHISLSEPEIG